jgi:hypothetical protein
LFFFDHLYTGAKCENTGANGMTSMEQKAKSTTVESVTVILEGGLDSTIKEWLRQVNLVPELTSIPLSDADRTGHLPQLFDDLLCRLRNPIGDEPPFSVIAASAHGSVRFAQGYSAAMLVEESRILEVSTFGTLHLHWHELDQNQALLDVVIIADEADRQLKETVRSFMAAQDQQRLQRNLPLTARRPTAA